eukprot:13954553-Alexandrium_andersonii.AAC.1
MQGWGGHHREQHVNDAASHNTLVASSIFRAPRRGMGLGSSEICCRSLCIQNRVWMRAAIRYCIAGVQHGASRACTPSLAAA